jgi:Lytic polysaccharide mono-oxygenase, cellulose-degrading
MAVQSPKALNSLFFAVAFLALCTSTSGHGLLSEPRVRGAYYTQRPVRALATEQQMNGLFDFCPHCRNAGGVSALRNVAGNTNGEFWIPYKPLTGRFRNGAHLCGDPSSGPDDHSASGKFHAPSFMQYAETYTAGSVANFEVDLTTPHGGYLQFYLCDVESSGDIKKDTFSKDCVLLQRSPVPSCESGTDDECGPIDKNDPSKFWLPCRVSASLDQNQILGGRNSGANNKISYLIPDQAIKKGVIHMYWLTSNSCAPDGSVDYFTNGGWQNVRNSQCSGDGGTVGGFNPGHLGTCTTQAGKFPEEFWNCADVLVLSGNSGTATNQGPAVSGTATTIDATTQAKTGNATTATTQTIAMQNLQAATQVGTQGAIGNSGTETTQGPAVTETTTTTEATNQATTENATTATTQTIATQNLQAATQVGTQGAIGNSGTETTQGPAVTETTTTTEATNQATTENGTEATTQTIATQNLQATTQVGTPAATQTSTQAASQAVPGVATLAATQTVVDPANADDKEAVVATAFEAAAATVNSVSQSTQENSDLPCMPKVEPGRENDVGYQSYVAQVINNCMASSGRAPVTVVTNAPTITANVGGCFPVVEEGRENDSGYMSYISQVVANCRAAGFTK